MKRILFALAVLSLAAGTVLAQGSNARVRIVHASPDAPAVDIYVNGGMVLENMPFREYSEYLSLPAGTYTVEIKVSGTNTVVKQLSVPVQAGKDYTAIAVGYAGGSSPGFDVMLLEDDNSAPADGRIKVRIAHTAPGAPAVDIYVTTPFETLSGKQPVLTNVPFKAASGYLSLPIGMYQARVAVAGTRTIAIDSHRLVTWGGMIRTIIAVDNKGGGAPFDLILLPDRN
ncbi:MAG: hypothetical protein KatS3mg004_1017 [Bryobacteraceae bacterium]|nr:MAG: hypothetical protein KatS3mg004_1017 [Bryobacteraceae bacterium]